MKEKTITLNNVGAKTLKFMINHVLFTVNYTDESLKDLVMMSNDTQSVLDKYEDLKAAINDTETKIDREQVSALFEELKTSLFNFFNKSFTGDNKADKLYETVGGVVVGGLTVVFQAVAEQINEAADGKQKVKGVKSGANANRNN